MGNAIILGSRWPTVAGDVTDIVKVFEIYLQPANEVCEGYVFTGVCPLFRGVSVRGSPSQGDLCLGGLCSRGCLSCVGVSRGYTDHHQGRGHP